MLSVTKIIDLLNKPAIVGWANKIGLKGISLDDYRMKLSKEGIKNHNDIENYLLNGVDFPKKEALIRSISGFNVLGVEKTVSNGFLIGRVDLILSKNNETYIVDFKRGNSIYLNTKLQLSAYKHMINADKICYLNTHDFVLKVIDIDTNKYYDIVKRLYQVQELLDNLNERL